ncbi:MAG: FliM/FliN family flagellar motor switch protein, partial [Kangiellaceae bacterium]|nr:FliM/FliN family flagellar motor switch protein [Kangiellaceae bacterium]
FWSKADLSFGCCYLGLCWGESSVKNLVKQICKHSVKELEQSKLDWFELAKTSSYELIESLGVKRSKEDLMINHFLNELDSLQSESEKFLGAICKMNLGFGTVELYLPNLVLMHLALGYKESEKEGSKKVELTPRNFLLDTTEVTVRAKIDGFKLSIKDLNTLQKGDVITTRESRDSQLSLFVNRSPVYVGKSTLGKKGNHRAIKIN